MSESGTKDSGCIRRMAASDRIPRRMFSLARAFFLWHVLCQEDPIFFIACWGWQRCQVVHSAAGERRVRIGTVHIATSCIEISKEIAE